MISNDGTGSSGRIIEDQYITAPISAGGDGITVYGSDGPVVIRRCVVDLGSWPLERLDEGLSGVDGARAVVRETRVAGVGKGILWGNGDYPETDPGAELVLEDCIVRDIGRRAPEAQDGVRVLMRRCVIRNWGVRSRFTVRGFAAWAHDVIETQLAHAPADSVRAAYNRAAWLDDRRRMLQAWADYLDQLKAQAGRS